MLGTMFAIHLGGARSLFISWRHFVRNKAVTNSVHLKDSMEKVS